MKRNNSYLSERVSVLVTGGAGFIGSNFIHYILDRYPQYIIINLDKLTYAGNLNNLKDVSGNSNYYFVKGDISNYELVNYIFEVFQPRYVVNFAAESHVDRSIEDPGIFLRTNILGTQVLLDVAKKHWYRANNWRNGVKFIQISTDEVYGSLGPEGFFTEKTPLDPHSPYSASKASADFIVKSYFDTFKMPINITRCSNNYGPYQFPEKLIPLMINNALNHKELPVYGDGKQVRDWLYVEDHCRAIDLVMQKGKLGEVYNIGGHNEKENIYIVKKIIELLRKMTGDVKINESLIKHVKDRPGHDRRYAIDPSKIEKELHWKPEVNFDRGIVKTVSWYLNNIAWVRNVTNGEYRNYYKRMYEWR